jgi:hypothetical protein|tara:strand:- start:116 stop:478 length:363 start_codon:yes stop_codon:yes gene_type:complete
MMNKAGTPTIEETLGLKNLKLGDHFDLIGTTVASDNVKAIQGIEMTAWEEGARVFIEATGETELIKGNKLGDLLQAIDRKIESGGETKVLSGVYFAIGTPYEARAQNYDLLASVKGYWRS